MAEHRADLDCPSRTLPEAEIVAYLDVLAWELAVCHTEWWTWEHPVALGATLTLGELREY